jgi:hypothetical protein
LLLQKPKYTNPEYVVYLVALYGKVQGKNGTDFLIIEEVVFANGTIYNYNCEGKNPVYLAGLGKKRSNVHGSGLCLVVRLDFKSSGRHDECLWWVRFPHAPAKILLRLGFRVIQFVTLESNWKLKW